MTPSHPNDSERTDTWRRDFAGAPRDGGALAAWFASLADVLLNQCVLATPRARYRLVEVEAYHVGACHADPYAHGAPQQASSGRWYLHRTGRSFRNGSFKGLDVTFGPDDSFGGLLLRAAQTLEGDPLVPTGLIEGPSRWVDRLLADTRAPSLAVLDGLLQGEVWDPAAAVRLEPTPDLPRRRLCSAPRIGLNLKRIATHPEMPRYLAGRWRYLTLPGSLRKGAHLVAAAMLADGIGPEEVARVLDTSTRVVASYADWLREGEQLPNGLPFAGRGLGRADHVRLCGHLWRGEAS